MWEHTVQLKMVPDYMDGTGRNNFSPKSWKAVSVGTLNTGFGVGSFHTFFYRHFLSGITKKSLNAFYYACSYAKVDCSGFMNVTAKIALHLIPESLKSQPVFIRFAGIEISYYEQKTFWSLCSYMVRSCKGIEMMINLINITYCGMKLLSYQDEKFSDYRDKSVQDFRFALSECIRQQVFFATFVKNIETRINSSSVINALKRAIVKQEHYFIKLFVCPPLNELILNWCLPVTLNKE